MLHRFRCQRIITTLFFGLLLLLDFKQKIIAEALNASHHLQILTDFLELKQLNQAIIVRDATSSRQMLSQQLDVSAIGKTVRRKWLSVYTLTSHPKGNEDFREKFSNLKSRVGVFVSDATGELVRRQVLEQASAGNFYNLRQSWLVMMPDIDQAREIFSLYNINIDSDITVGVTLPNETVVLYDLHKICHRCNTALKVHYKGFWSGSGGFRLLSEYRETFVQRRKNFEGLSMRSVTVLKETPAHLTNEEFLENDIDYQQLDFIPREFFSLLKLLRPLFNMSYDIHFEKSWGQFRNGSWDGIIGALVSGEAEVSLHPSRMTRERILIVNFLPQLFLTQVPFIFRHPRRIIVRNIFLDPFEDSVWWSVLMLVVAAIGLLWLLIRQECRWQQNPSQSFQCTSTLADTSESQPQPPTPTTPTTTTTIIETKQCDFSILVILSAIFMQGPSLDPFNMISTRTLVTTISVFTLLLMQFYGAFIVGSLFSTPPRTITNLAALYNSPLDIGMENMSYNYDTFYHTLDPRARKIYLNRISKNPRRNILTIADGADRIKRGGFALMAERERLHRVLKTKLTEVETCDIQEVYMEPFITSCAVRRDSPFREHLTSGYILLRTSGLMRYTENNWKFVKPDCSLIQNSNDEKVDIEHFSPALIFLASSMFGSVIVLFIELIIKWFEKYHFKFGESRKEKNEKKRKKIILKKSWRS